MAIKLLWLALGGTLGTWCRFAFAEWAISRWSGYLPVGTLLANGLGCLLIGLLVGLLEARVGAVVEAPPELRLLLMTGFLGALTTFSAFELEAFLYMREGLWMRALLYLVGSLILGLLLLAGGFQAGRMLGGLRV